jgi:hypothetical protein
VVAPHWIILDDTPLHCSPSCIAHLLLNIHWKTFIRACLLSCRCSPWRSQFHCLLTWITLNNQCSSSPKAELLCYMAYKLLKIM